MLSLSCAPRRSFVFFKQKTAYEVRISDWSADVCSSDLPLAQSACVGLADLAAQDFIGLAEGSALQDHIAQHSRRAGAPLNYRVRLRSFDAVCQLAGRGIGIGIVPRAAARRCARASGIQAVALAGAWAHRNLLLFVRRVGDLPAYTQPMLPYLLTAPHPAPPV